MNIRMNQQKKVDLDRVKLRTQPSKPFAFGTRERESGSLSRFDLRARLYTQQMHVQQLARPSFLPVLVDPGRINRRDYSSYPFLLARHTKIQCFFCNGS
jgi:hypothetical protein